MVSYENYYLKKRKLNNLFLYKDLKISEILKESSKKEIKLKADFERRITETKMKQWVNLN